jgi:hypothetical protein
LLLCIQDNPAIVMTETHATNLLLDYICNNPVITMATWANFKLQFIIASSQRASTTQSIIDGAAHLSASEGAQKSMLIVEYTYVPESIMFQLTTLHVQC